MEKVDMIESLIKNNIAPMLVNKNIENIAKKYAVIIEQTMNNKEILCSYNENTGEKVPPTWLKKLNENKKPILLIKDIDKTDFNEQIKFKEIIKYKTINNMKMPENTVIFVSYNEIAKVNPIISELLIKVVQV